MFSDNFFKKTTINLFFIFQQLNNIKSAFYNDLIQEKSRMIYFQSNLYQIIIDYLNYEFWDPTSVSNRIGAFYSN
jgi:hypothetical protein